MRTFRALGLSGVVAVAFLACTFTRSLDYLTSGGPDGGGIFPESGNGGADGDAKRDTVADAQFSPRNLTQDADNLYWSNSDGAIMTASKGGGQARRLGAAPGGAAITWLAADSGAGGHVYAIVGDAVQRVSKSGGELTLVEKNTPKPLALVLDDTSLFVAHSDLNSPATGDLARFSKDGTSRVVLSVDGDEPATVALHGSSVFWAGISKDGLGVVFELPKTAPPDAGKTVKIHNGPTPDDAVYPDKPEAFAVDDDAIYYLELDITHRLARDQATAPTTVFEAPEGTKPTALAIDDQNVYIVDQRDKGAIIRVPKKGGAPPTAVALNQPVPTSVVADATAVYFTVQGSGLSADGAVLRVAK